jgi:hypothetical protein
MYPAATTMGTQEARRTETSSKTAIIGKTGTILTLATQPTHAGLKPLPRRKNLVRPARLAAQINHQGPR